jgi:UDP-glucuronate 4-epimerase
MIASIERTLDREARIVRKPMQPGDVELTCADISRSAAELDYRPATSFEAGLAKQWAWMRTQAT